MTNPKKYSIEYCIWVFFLSGFFILSSYKLQRQYSHIYHIFLLMSLISIVHMRSMLKYLANKYTYWMLIAIFILTLFFIAGYGDEKGSRSLKIFFYSIPFFLLGLKIGLSNLKPYFNIFMGAILLALAMLALKDMMTLGLGALSGLHREELAWKLGIEDRQKFILHYPTLSVVTLFSCGLYGIKSFLSKIGVFTCQSILFISIIVSTWTGATVLLIIGVCSLLLFNMKRFTVSPFKSIIIILSAIVALVAITNLLGMAKKGRGKVQAERITAIAENIFNADEIINIMDKNSGGRISLAKKSIIAFIDSPLIGIGPCYHTEKKAGGHSFIFDTLSFYGILGGGPIFIMLFIWIVAGIKNCSKKDASWQEMASAVVLVSVFLGCFYNPYLIHSRLDYLYFFAAGIASGNRYTSKARKKYGKMISVKSTGLLKIAHNVE